MVTRFINKSENRTRAVKITVITAVTHKVVFLTGAFIKDNIKKFENINNEEERKKILKDFQNSKSSISKKIPLELLELELEQSKNAGTVLHNITQIAS